jgi:hypothetical protein
VSTPLGVEITPKLGKPGLSTSVDGSIPTVFPALSVPSSELNVTHQFQTNIIMSRQGREQRRALRGNPRRQLEYSTTITGQRWLDYRRFMVRGQRMLVSIAYEARVVTVISALTSNSFGVDSVPAWLVVGCPLILFKPGGNFFFTRVFSVVGSTVTITSTAATPIASGTRVYQALFGHLALQLDQANTVTQFGTGKVTFTEDPGLAAADFDIPATTSWNGRECFLFTPNKFEPITITYSTDREDVDFGLGSLTSFDPTGLHQQMFGGTYGVSVLEAETLRAMFNRMKGQQGEFYMPTFENDLPPFVTATSGTNTLEVAGTDVKSFYQGSTIFKQLCVFLDEATPISTVVFNTVSSMALSGGNTVLTLANNWAQDITTSMKVSWMPVWRFATDMLQMTWTFNYYLDARVTVKPTFKMLEDL